MSFKKKQRGQGMTEYVIIVAVIAIAALSMFAGFGDSISDRMTAGAETVSNLKMK